MVLSVGKKALRLPSGYLDTDQILRAVIRHNPPFAVHAQHPPPGRDFSVRKPVFLSVDDLSVECEDEGELRFACKLVAMDHNRWQAHDGENLQEVMAETNRMEEEAKARMEAPLTEEDFLPEELVHEEEDISIEEWSQRGYKWFRGEDVIYS